MRQLGIAVIVAGLMVIVFMVLFGFPAAPPRPVDITYSDPASTAPPDTQDIVFRGGYMESNGPHNPIMEIQ